MAKTQSKLKTETLPAVSEDMRLVLRTGQSQRLLSIPIGMQQLVVGRACEGYIPDIDLNAFQALEHGISRKHATFILRDGELFIEDLNSMNGTLINGFQIPPNRLYRLRNGDEVELGRLRFIVLVVRVPSR